MAEYGYINEGGYLRSRNIESYQEKYLDGKEVKTRIVSEQEQIDKLTPYGWKPVEQIEQSKLNAAPGYIVRVTPYDAGDCIKFKYESVKDIQQSRRKVEELKQSLTDSDYKVIKCYEASLAGEPLPYDFGELREERQAIRQRINELEDDFVESK